MNNAIKTIIVDYRLAGTGCPNKEGNEGKTAWNQWARSVNAAENAPKIPIVTENNVTFNKCNLYTKDGNIVRKVKLSGTHVRHGIFGSTNSAAIKEDAVIWAAYTASAEGILRGYLNPNKDGTTTKRKSVFTATDAEEVSGAVPKLEVFSASGIRTDTSFFQKEVIGESEYAGRLEIDLSELQFMSCCDTFDRPCVAEEMQPLYEQNLKANGFSFVKGAYKKKNDVQPEIGYMLSDTSVETLVNTLLAKLSSFHSSNATEYVDFKSMTITMVPAEGDRFTANFVDGKLDTDYTIASQYETADYDEALKANRKAKELIEATKKKEPKGKKGSKKSAPAEEK